MAIVEVKVPQLSESVAEATLLAWKKKPGEAVTLKVWRQGRTLTLRVVPQVLR